MGNAVYWSPNEYDLTLVKENCSILFLDNPGASSLLVNL